MAEISREMFQQIAAANATLGAEEIKQVLASAGITVAKGEIDPEALHAKMREIIESYIETNRANNEAAGRKYQAANVFYPDDIMWMLDDAIREVQRG